MFPTLFNISKPLDHKTLNKSTKYIQPIIIFHDFPHLVFGSPNATRPCMLALLAKEDISLWGCLVQ